MNLLQQPNKWSCFPTAVAMVLGVEVETVIQAVGHDGSEIVWPSLEDPFRRRCFHPQEIQDAVEKAFHCVMVIYDLDPVSYNEFSDKIFRPCGKERVKKVLESYDGVLAGITMKGNFRHAVAWNKQKQLCYDPMGHRYGIDLFKPEFFFRFVSIL
jgi:hypothetical protein